MDNFTFNFSYQNSKTNQSCEAGFRQADTSRLRSYTLLAKLKLKIIS